MRKWFVAFIVACLVIPISHVHAVSRELVGKCGHWLDDALDVGWSRSDLSELDYIMWRESRCFPGVFNSSDPNGGSGGLLQINQFWCLPNKYNPSGWLQSQGILDSCKQLLIPKVNLEAGLAIFEYSEERNGNGWQPWGK